MSSPDPTLLDIFASEQAEHVARMRSLLEALDANAPDPGAIEELLRRAHTLKGAARAAGFEPTELLMHAVEGVFAGIRSGKQSFSDDFRPVFLRSIEAAEDILAAVLAQLPMPDVSALLRDVERWMGGSPAPLAAAPIVPAKPELAPAEIRPAENAVAVPSAELLRVNAAHLDEWMSASSELAAASRASDAALAEGSQRAEDALRAWWRLRQDAAPALRSMQDKTDFAPVLECIQGAERQINLLANAIRTDAANRQRREWDLERLAGRLTETALRVRMVTAETAFGAFASMVRNLAREHSKTVEFRAEGLELPVDRLVLQLLKDPVMHLLRNALSHGIETEDDRVAAGKPPAGTIRLVLASRGERLKVVVEDDGRGIDRRALVDEAMRQGIRDLSSERLEDLIFRPGFSTSTLTTLSGCGMGLAIVRHEVARLHGEVRVHSEPRKGTSITISVPLSISSQHVLLVGVGGHTFGILTAFVEQLQRVERSAIETHNGKPALVIDSTPVPLTRLSSVLDLRSESTDETGVLETVVLASGGQRAAIVVDDIEEVRDVVVKPLGLAAKERGLGAGAVPLPNGGVAVLLDIGDLFYRLLSMGAAKADTFAPASATARGHRILVVDDSMTTRSLEKSLLEAHGYDVQVAVDGVEALEKLRAQPADLVISDLMMPRMDGFELLARIRQDKALTKTPVIVVSSIESREDQERGLALGADAFIVKRKFDQRHLLEMVRQFL